LEDPTAVRAGQASPVQAPQSVAADLGRKSDQPATGADEETVEEKGRHEEL
ncbi:hypothetical protein LPJ57_002323, partial [Coemansia sp. RSA 486]